MEPQRRCRGTPPVRVTRVDTMVVSHEHPASLACRDEAGISVCAVLPQTHQPISREEMSDQPRLDVPQETWPLPSGLSGGERPRH